MNSLKKTIEAEVTELLRSGMPEAVVRGFMTARVRDLVVDEHTEQSWSQVRRICDEVGAQAHGGDPVKKARVDQFNDMFLAELRKRQYLR